MTIHLSKVDGEVILRIATLIVGIIFAFALFFQSIVADFGSSLSNNENLETAAALAMVGSLLWLLASALVIAFPLGSTVLFGLASLVMITGGSQFADDYPDLQYWGWIGLVFAVSSFFGWRGKRQSDAEKREEKERQMQRDAMLEQMLRQQALSAPASSEPNKQETHAPANSTGRPNWMN